MYEKEKRSHFRRCAFKAMKLTENWSLHEIAHPDILATVGNRCADFLHPELANTCQALRDQFGALFANGMFNGQLFTSSGLRLPLGHTGAMMSDHKFGCAVDLKSHTVTPINMQNYIIMHQDQFPYITRLESALVTKTWLHVSVGTREGTIKIFNP